jgi:hypothetical protein
MYLHQSLHVAFSYCSLRWFCPNSHGKAHPLSTYTLLLWPLLLISAPLLPGLHRARQGSLSR